VLLFPAEKKEKLALYSGL